MTLKEELAKIDPNKLRSVADAIVRRHVNGQEIEEVPINRDWQENNSSLVALSEGAMDALLDIAEIHGVIDDNTAMEEIETIGSGIMIALFVLTEYCEVIETEAAFPGLNLDT